MESSGAPGSLVAALSSIDGSGSLRVDVPLVSVDASVYRGGNHPFRLDGGSQAVAYLKNVGAKPTTAIVVIRYAGGEFTPPMLNLAPGETVGIDLRQLRDSGAKDIRGRSLPQTLTEGQIAWSPHRTERMIGRVVALDATLGTSRNFSCLNCCGDDFDHLEHTPLSITGLIGSSQQISVQEFTASNCGSGTAGPYDVTNQCNYSSNNTAVATVGTTGM